MKTSFFFVSNLFFLIIFSSVAIASDVYAEYKMTGMTTKPVVSKMYIKNGDIRTEVAMDIGGSLMKTTTLMLKKTPNVTLVLNSASKTYTETKTAAANKIPNIDIKVIGQEKIGNYNCTHVRMTAEGKSWDMWYAKDLPSVNFPVNGNDALGSGKMIAQLKSKGITGMPVKIAFLKPNTNTASVTMLLTKFEQKNLDASLFAIPAGYKKNGASFDPEKMKNMTPQQQKEMIMKMMKAQQPK